MNLQTGFYEQLIGELTGDAALGEAALPADTEMFPAILLRLNLPRPPGQATWFPGPSPGFRRARSSSVSKQSRRLRAVC
jgi:hypothetical protein